MGSVRYWANWRFLGLRNLLGVAKPFQVKNFCLNPSKVGETLIWLHRENEITIEDVKQSLEENIDTEHIKNLGLKPDCLDALTWTILLEQEKGAESKYADYLATLPGNYDNGTLLWLILMKIGQIIKILAGGIEKDIAKRYFSATSILARDFEHEFDIFRKIWIIIHKLYSLTWGDSDEVSSEITWLKF